MRFLFNKSKLITYVSYLSIFWFIFSTTLIYSLNFPKILLYCGDVLVCFLLFLLLLTRKKIINNKTFFPLFSFMFLFLVLGFLVSFIYFDNLILPIWGIRNNAKYFILFFSFVVSFNQKDYKKIFDILILLFFISFPLCIIERFFVKYPSGTIVGDMVGGIFFNYSGCNTPLNILLIVVVTYYYCNYMEGNISLIKIGLVVIMSLLMAAMAELKIYIVEILIIMLSMFFLKKINKKHFIILVSTLVISFITINVFIALNSSDSYDYSSLFTLNGMIEYLTRESGYAGDDLNRFNWIGYVNKSIFNKDVFKTFFGVGLGNAEYTNYFSSSIYQKFSNMHYQWIHIIWMYIENGIIGVLCYLSIFIFMIYIMLKRFNDGVIRNMTIIYLMLIPVLLFYNISLRTEVSGTIYYFILSYPFALLWRRKYDS